MDVITRILEELHGGGPVCEHRRDEPMHKYTSFKIGGPVRVMFFPKSIAQLTEVCEFLKEFEIQPFILGKGTNLLAGDAPIERVVINTTGLDTIESISETRLAAGAGAPLSMLAMRACDCGLSGLEFAYGIPGTVGGAILMNAGAYDGEMKDVVSLTYAINPQTGPYIAKGAEHGFAYRKSSFSDSGDIITSAMVVLKEASRASIKAKMDELTELRRSTQPLDMPNAGSIFKRPKEGYAAALIDQAGLKGYRHGGAQISIKHAGFIINRGAATFMDVMTVIEHAKETVHRYLGVELELEVRIIR